MTKQEAIDELHKHYVPEYVNYIVTALTDGATPSDAPTIKGLAQEPCDNTVSREVLNQVVWERDMAIEQLRKLGYELGQKIEPCDDVLDKIRAEIESMDFDFGDFYDHTEQIVEKVCEVIDKYKTESEGKK